MLGFIIAGLILTISVGAFFALIVTRGLEGRKRVVIAIIIAFAVGFGLLRILIVENEKENEKWNNGVCIECGGKYEFQSSSYRRSADDKYYYKCKNCGYTIELNSLRNSQKILDAKGKK